MKKINKEMSGSRIRNEESVVNNEVTEVFDDEKEISELQSSGIVRQENNKDYESLEIIKEELDEARRMYAKANYKRNSLVEKTKGLFRDSVENKSDITRLYDNYVQALKKYRNEKLKGIEDLPEKEQKRILSELKRDEINEATKLYDAHSEAKAETLGGKIGKIVNNVVDKYQKLPRKVKLAVSAALFLGGIAVAHPVFFGAALTPSVAGITASVGIKSAIMGKRVLGSTMMGMGVTGMIEARATKQEQQKIKQEMEFFEQMSIEERRQQMLNAYDDKSMEKINNTLKKKSADHKRRVLYGIGTTAAAMVPFSKMFSHFFPVTIPVPNPELQSEFSEGLEMAKNPALNIAEQDIASETVIGDSGDIIADNDFSVNDALDQTDMSQSVDNPTSEGYLTFEDVLENEGDNINVGKLPNYLNEVSSMSQEDMMRIINEAESISTLVPEDAKQYFLESNISDNFDNLLKPQQAEAIEIMNRMTLEDILNSQTYQIPEIGTVDPKIKEVVSEMAQALQDMPDDEKNKLIFSSAMGTLTVAALFVGIFIL